MKLLAGVQPGLPRNSRGVLRRKSIPQSVRSRIWKLPCAICGVPDRTCVDHIIPVAQGGGSEEVNLQPLCDYCNHHKGHKRSNSEVREWVKRRGLKHFVTAIYENDNRYRNFYEWPWFDQWCVNHPELLEAAKRLFEEFQGNA